MDKPHSANWLQWIALALMALYAAFWALFGAGEIMAGDWSGIIHFGPVLLILGMMFLCWKRAMIGGVITLILGIFLSLRFYISMARPPDKLSAAVVIGGPFILAGLLFIIFAWLSRPRPTEENANL